MHAQSTTDSGPVWKDRKLGWIFWVGFIASAILMAAASRGDLAIDEVVSLRNAEGAKTWLELITRDPNDNNHLLNTFILRLLGSHSWLFIYRIPAVVFGIGMIAALALTARRWNKAAAVWVVYLAGWSCPIILYCSEARGYAPAMFFAVVAFEWLQRCWERCTPVRIVLFWLALCLGFLAHFSSGIVWAALGVWTLIHEKKAGASWRGALVSTVKYYAVPACFMAGVYLVYIRHMFILGGYPYTRLEVIGAAASYALGFANTTGLNLVSVILAVALVAYGIRVIFRHKQEAGWFFVLVLVVLPALVLLWHPRFLYFRYLLVCFPFFYLLLAIEFAEWFRRSGSAMKTLPVWMTLAITIGHAIKVSALLELGRGQYRRALQDMARATPGPVVRVSGDDDFKDGTMVEFYARFLPSDKRVEYIASSERHQEIPEWVVVVCFDPAFRAYPDLGVGDIGRYKLSGVYPFAGLSGWSWFVYQRPREEVAGPPDGAADTQRSTASSDHLLP